MRRVRLVIADRRPIVLQGFASLFAEERDFEVVASCLDGASCLEAVRNLTPDVVLVEDGFSDVTASELLAVANAENLPTRLVFFTASVARGDLAAAIAAGACSAISMRARPENLMQSLRRAAPRPGLVSAGEEEISENVLALLTDKERRVMRLVAQGLSNKAIARQLDVSPGTIKVHLNHIFRKLEINNRTQLAALAQSYRYGGIGALAALIFAAMDDVRAASPDAEGAGHAVTDTVTVTAADGTAEVVTVVVNRPKESAGAADTAPRALLRARDAANAATVSPTPIGKLVGSGADITASTLALAALNSPRPSAGSFGTYMMAAAAGVFLYELDIIYSAAHAFAPADDLTDVFTSTTANGTRELVTLTIPGSVDVNPDGFDNLASLNPGLYDRPFAFGTPRGDAIAGGGDKPWIIDAAAGEDGANGNVNDHASRADSAEDTANRSDAVYEVSATVDALAEDTTDHGNFGEATADASDHVEHSAIPASAGDGSDPGQSQRDLHASEGGPAAADQHASHDAPEDSNRGQSQRDWRGPEESSAAANQHARNDPPGHDSNRGQSQRDLHDPEEGPAGAKQHARHDPPGHDSNRGQLQRDLHDSEEGPAGAKQHAEHDPPGHDSNRGQSQRDLHAAEESFAAAKLARHDAPGDDFNRGQSQRDSHASEEGSAVRQHAEHDPPGHDFNRGQSQRDSHASEDGLAAAKQHARHDPPTDDSDRGKSQRDLPASEEDFSAAKQNARHDAPANDSNHGQSQRDLHAANAGGKEQAHADDAGQAETAAAPKLGHSFQFKNEMAASKAPDNFEVHVDHGPDPAEHGKHAAGHDGPAPIPDADLLGASFAEQNAPDHASGTGHHVAHDLIV